MPFSQSSQISPIINLIEKEQPSTLLDVGTGFGQYGFLARTNLEHLNLFEVDGPHSRRREKTEWSIVIDGIEAFPKYITPVHDYAYDSIFIGDAIDLLPNMSQSYDMVLAIDILEHFDKDRGLRFIELLQLASRGSVIISTPKEFIHQVVEANPYENHRSVWTLDELEALGYTQISDNDESWIVGRKDCEKFTEQHGIAATHGRASTFRENKYAAINSEI